MSSVKTIYQSPRDKATSDKMITDYLPLVRHIVGRLPVLLPSFMDRDDMIGVGILGLINAAKTYDPDMGASFKTYAYINIKGAILDELRHHDIVPRSIRDKMKKVEEATDRLVEKNGCIPTPEEIATEVGIPLKTIDALIVSSGTISLLSIDEKYEGTGGTHRFLDFLTNMTDDPAAIVQESEQKELLTKAISKLPEIERQVVYLYYNKNMLLKEIGAVLEVSESRICQVLSRAHFLLNKEIVNMGG